MYDNYSLNQYLSASEDMMRVRRRHADWFGQEKHHEAPHSPSPVDERAMQAFNDNLFLRLVRPSSFEDVQAPKIEMSSLALAMMQEARDTVEASPHIVPPSHSAFDIFSEPLYDMVEDEDGVYRPSTRELVDA